jgi:hypothetical protein
LFLTSIYTVDFVIHCVPFQVCTAVPVYWNKPASCHSPRTCCTGTENPALAKVTNAFAVGLQTSNVPVGLRVKIKGGPDRPSWFGILIVFPFYKSNFPNVFKTLYFLTAYCAILGNA